MDEEEKLAVFLDSCITADNNNGVTGIMANRRIKDESELLSPLSVRFFELNDNLIYFVDYFSRFLKEKFKQEENHPELKNSILKVIKAYIEFTCTELNPYGACCDLFSRAQSYHVLHTSLENIIDMEEFGYYMRAKEHLKIFGKDVDDDESVLTMYEISDYVSVSIDRILCVNDVMDGISRFMGDDLTNIYFVRLLNTSSILMEKCEDFRIFQWEKERMIKMLAETEKELSNYE